MRKYVLPVIALAMLVRADVMTQTYTRMKMVGGMMTTEVTTTTNLRPDMKAEDLVQNISTMLGGKPQHTATITRLDKELIWNVSHDNKTYAESPLKLPEAKANVEAKGSASGQADTTYRIVKSEFAVKKLDSTKTINGFPCTGYLATWTLVIEQTATKQQTTSIMTTNEWTTPLTDVLKQAQAAEEAYSKAYLAKLGVPAAVTSEQNQMMGASYLATLGMSPQAVSDKMAGMAVELSKIEGYPIVTDVKWQVPPDSTKSKSEPKHESGPSLGSGLPSLGDLVANRISQGIENQNASNGSTVFETHHELKSVSVGTSEDKNYLVPEGYKNSNAK